MDLSKWNDQKRARILDWLERLRPWIAEGLELGFTLKEVSLEVRKEALRYAKARWGLRVGAKELGMTKSAFWQALEKVGQRDGRVS